MADDPTPLIFIGAGVVMLAFWAYNRLVAFPRVAMLSSAQTWLPLLTRLNNVLPVLGVFVILIGVVLPFL